jgi:outer membrane immunogenic protein
MYRDLKLVFGVVLGLGGASFASAADLPVKAPVAAAPLYNWTGCYVGGNVGGGSDTMHTVREQIDGTPPTPAYLDMGTENDSGYLGGVQAGCDFQTTRLVFGVEAQGDWGKINGSQNIASRPGFSEQNSLNGLFPVTGKFGFLWTPQLLTYGKLGVAWFNDRNQYFANGALFESTKWTDPMITAGIGVEYMFTPNWSVFAEGSYYWAESDDAAHDYVSPSGLPVETINSRPRIITGLVGVNYKFHWDSGPVVAKY